MNYAVEIDRAIDDEQLASALSLAERWVAEFPDEGRGRSKLAHVHEITEDFAKSSSAAAAALRISPDYPPYLFQHGYAEYRLGNHAEAANSFGLCAAQSEKMQDAFYLDAARIAQARCLVLDGRADLAADVIAKAATSSATWLDKRYSKEDVVTSVRSAMKKPKTPR